MDSHRRLPRRLALAAAALAIAASVATPAFAQGTWPDRPITMIVPFPPGGVADTVARPVAEALARELKQPVVIENKAGAGGAVGMGYAARAAADGYTILISLPAEPVQADRALHRRPDGVRGSRRCAVADAEGIHRRREEEAGRLHLRLLRQLRDDARADGDAEGRSGLSHDPHPVHGRGPGGTEDRWPSSASTWRRARAKSACHR